MRTELGVLALMLATAPAHGQGAFDSGSNGSDGALTFAANAGTINFDPATYTPRLDLDGDYVFHFTTITIPVGTTVRLRTAFFVDEGKPVVWLASGAVTIAGTLDLDGENGHAATANPVPAAAGAGGWTGGVGGGAATPQTSGNGPGGGLANNAHGGHASHAIASVAVSDQGGSGATYGNIFLRPLQGGSGGAGGRFGADTQGGGGGGGGGALVVASSVSIKVDGTVRAQGGSGAGSFAWGGGGSGGGIRLVAPVLEGAGTVNVRGGFNHANGASHGRVRFEGYKFPQLPSVTPVGALTRAAPSPVFLPTTAPLVKVVRVAGQDVVASPSGSFVVPDVVINAAGATPVEIETRNVPAGTVLSVTLQPENGSMATTSSTPVSLGAGGVGTATASVTFPSGSTRIFVRGSWTP